MKSVLIVSILLLNFSFLFCEVLLINKTDGSTELFALTEIIDLTFNEVGDEVLQIVKTNGSTDDIALGLIENVEFIVESVSMMRLNKTDGTIYEIETSQIEHIIFIGVTSIKNESDLIVSHPISSLKNFPNPFNPNTKISFELNEQGYVTIEIFNLRGAKIITLLEETLSLGEHNADWNGNIESGEQASSGLYLYKITVNGQQKISKMLLLK